MLLARSKERGLVTKSGIMVGLGEERDELRGTLRNLQQAGCDVITIGQYLQPNRSALSVVRYYRPEEFEEIRNEALALGLKYVLAGPRMRSSYHAGHHGVRSVRCDHGKR
jgi:lipoic acid synthetase